MSGLDADKQILRACPGTRVLLLTMHRSERQVSAALQAGIHGYITKTQAADHLTDAIRAVTRGKIYLSLGKSGSAEAGLRLMT